MADGMRSFLIGGGFKYIPGKLGLEDDFPFEIDDFQVPC